KEVYRSFNTVCYQADKAVYGSGSQTSLPMPFYMGLVDPSARRGVSDNLVGERDSRGTSFTAGGLGHRYLLEALRHYKRDDLIVAMDRDDTRPGYGYQIRKGATA